MKKIGSTEFIRTFYLHTSHFTLYNGTWSGDHHSSGTTSDQEPCLCALASSKSPNYLGAVDSWSKNHQTSQSRRFPVPIQRIPRKIPEDKNKIPDEPPIWWSSRVWSIARTAVKKSWRRSTRSWSKLKNSCKSRECPSCFSDVLWFF